MRELTHVTAAIFRHVDFVPIVYCLNSGKSHTSLRPQASEHDLLAAGLFNGSHEVLIVPGVHGGTFDGLLIWEDGVNLRPEMSTEGVSLNCRQHDRYAEHPCSLCKCHSVVYDSLTIKVAGSKQHLGLMINQSHDTIVGSEQTFFAPL